MICRGPPRCHRGFDHVEGGWGAPFSPYGSTNAAVSVNGLKSVCYRSVGQGGKFVG